MHKETNIAFVLKKKDRQAIKKVSMSLCMTFLILLLTACNVQRNTPVIEDGIPENFDSPTPGGKDQECPELDSKLYQLFLMDDPIPSAEQLGFRVLDGKVQVVLVLVSEESTIPAGFDLDVGTRVGDQVQVFVPFNALCELAMTAEVIAIRQPIAPILE